MFDYAVLEVAIGLFFVYLTLSVVCSALNETVSSIFSWRAKFLREGVANLLEPENQPRGRKLAEQLYMHPLINGLIRPVSRRGRRRYPSYLPSRTFVAALLDFDASGAEKSVEQAIAKVPSEEARKALTALLKNAEGDAARFRRSAEQWFDDAMERVSGWYRRRTQVMLWVLGACLVVALNADTVRMAERLWSDKTVRSVVIARADSASTSAQTPDLKGAAREVQDLRALDIPIGWGVEPRPSGTEDWLVTVLLKILGLTLTAAALTLGAPFWFDLLSKVARLRSSGAPPPASDAVRKGEGEEERVAPSVSAQPVATPAPAVPAVGVPVAGE
jgi:hypothetical protein